MLVKELESVLLSERKEIYKKSWETRRRRIRKTQLPTNK